MLRPFLSVTRESKQSRFSRKGFGRGANGRNLRHEQLETRSMLSVNPLDGFDGLDYGDTNEDRAGTTLAVSENYVAQVAGHRELAIYDRTANNSKVFQQDLDSFFAGVAESALYGASVGYDSDLERFVVFADDDDGLLYAISDTADPTADPDNDGSSFSVKVKIDLPDGLFSGTRRFGWNADAQVISIATYSDSSRSFSSHVDTTLFIIDKSSLVDGSPGINATTLSLPDHLRFAVPAAMQGANPGDPMWLVGRSVDTSPTQVSVIQVSNLLSTMDVADYDLIDAAVAGYDAAEQPGNKDITVLGPAFRSAQWRDGRLVTTAHGQSQTDPNESDVFWYEFDTTGVSPTVAQTGVIDPGQGVWAYYPTIAIAPDGDLGLTYMQSSNSEYMSMYVTGQTSDDPLGQMQTPVLAKAGVASISFGKSVSAPYEPSNSSITVDAGDGSFWAAGEYADRITKGGKDPNWATWISNFEVVDDAPEPPTLSIADVSFAEGDNGTTDFEFTVTRSGDVSQQVTVDVSTADGSAAAGSDYVAIPATTITIATNVTTQNITITVNGDTADEGDENFFVNLSNPVGATISDGQAVATIVNDDAALTALYITDIWFDSKRGGKDWRAVVEVRSDEDDAPVAGVNLRVDFAGTTYELTTDSNGIARTSWERNLNDGNYYADAYDLAFAGFVWNPFSLDLEDDSDGDGKPDDLLVLV